MLDWLTDHVLRRLGFYATLLRPRGWLGILVAIAGAGYALLQLYRDEGWQDKQPPLLVDVLDWLPWWLWFVLLAVAAIVVICESAYQLLESNKASQEQELADLKARVASLDAQLTRDDLIEVSPSHASSLKPIGQGNTAREVVAYLDVQTADVNKPLRNCRVKLVELHHYLAVTDRNTREVIERWDRDSFYAGQTYFFRWSGRGSSIDAVDVHSRERASIARCVGTTATELTTTAEGPASHMFHGDQYHLVVEITADNSRPATRDYWLQLHQGDSPVIEEWDENRTTWL